MSDINKSAVTPPAFAANLSGAQELVDSEVISLELNREGVSLIRVHYFCTTGSTNASGQYITNKHAIVSFVLENITRLELGDFNDQNVVSAIPIKPVGDEYEITLGSCYGISGHIRACRLSLELQPGMPSKSIYAETIL